MNISPRPPDDRFRSLRPGRTDACSATGARLPVDFVGGVPSGAAVATAPGLWVLGLCGHTKLAQVKKIRDLGGESLGRLG